MPSIKDQFEGKGGANNRTSIYDTDPRGGFPIPTVANRDPNILPINNTFSKGRYLDFVQDSPDGGNQNISDRIKDITEGTPIT
jgi:hypothetical protein